jgi:hypothetical protein
MVAGLVPPVIHGTSNFQSRRHGGLPVRSAISPHVFFYFGENFGGIFGEPLPHGHAARTPRGIIVGGGNEGDSINYSVMRSRSGC